MRHGTCIARWCLGWASSEAHCHCEKRSDEAISIET
jgi:hypothetical protein